MVEIFRYAFFGILFCFVLYAIIFEYKEQSNVQFSFDATDETADAQHLKPVPNLRLIDRPRPNGKKQPNDRKGE